MRYSLGVSVLRPLPRWPYGRRLLLRAAAPACGTHRSRRCRVTIADEPVVVALRRCARSRAPAACRSTPARARAHTSSASSSAPARTGPGGAAAPARSSTGPLMARRRRAARCVASIGSSACASNVAPLARHGEILQRQAERIDHAVAAVAARRPCDAARAARAPSSASRPRGVVRFGLDARRRRRGRRAHELVEHPGAAQHRRRAVAIGRAQQHGALAEQAAPRVASTVTRRNCGPCTPADAVVARQPLVEEGVVGRQQLVHVAGPRAARSRGTARSRWRNPSRSASLNSGNRRSSGSTASRSSTLSQRSAKPVTSACARGSASMRSTCASSTSAVVELAARPRACSSSSSGPGSTGRTTGATPARSRRARTSRRLSRSDGAMPRYRKSGLASTAVTSCSTPPSKLPVRAARLVERHQSLEVARRRPGGERRGARACVAMRSAQARVPRRRSAGVQTKILSRLAVRESARCAERSFDADAADRRAARASRPCS